MSKKFKVGDKVKIKSWETMKKEFGLDYGNDIRTNPCFVKGMKHLCGRIATITRFNSENSIELNFEDKSGDIEWSYCVDMIEHYGNETIVIYLKDNEVIALNKATGKKGVAKCNPEDTFDFNIGAKLAFERLMTTYRIVKQDKYEVGDKVKIIDKWIPGCAQNHEGRMDKYLGKVMTIRYITYDGAYKMVEDEKEHCGGWYWNNKCIEGKVVEEDVTAVKEEPKKPTFKVGDTIEMLEDFFSVPKGVRGTVVKVSNYDLTVDFHVKYLNTHDCNCLPEKTGLWLCYEQVKKVN